MAIVNMESVDLQHAFHLAIGQMVAIDVLQPTVTAMFTNIDVSDIVAASQAIRDAASDHLGIVLPPPGVLRLYWLLVGVAVSAE